MAVVMVKTFRGTRRLVIKDLLEAINYVQRDATKQPNYPIAGVHENATLVGPLRVYLEGQLTATHQR